jgi:hypothetical protein
MSWVTDTQHEFQEVIISTQHIHLDHHNCLEIVAARGNAEGFRTGRCARVHQGSPCNLWYVVRGGRSVAPVFLSYRVTNFVFIIGLFRNGSLPDNPVAFRRKTVDGF